MPNIYIQYFKTPIGELILGSYGDQLCMADMRYRKMRKRIDARLQKGLNAVYVEEDTAVLQQARHELDEYFNRERQSFDVPLWMVGTDFQKQVWQGLIDIPYGTTCSYLELSKNIGNEKAVRAVASAGGLPAKKKLLMLEQTIL